MKIDKKVSLTITFEGEEIDKLLETLVTAKYVIKPGEYPHSFILNTIERIRRTYETNPN